MNGMCSRFSSDHKADSSSLGNCTEHKSQSPDSSFEKSSGPLNKPYRTPH